MKKIITIIGTRPEIIKMFPVIKELDNKFNQILVWSGQHFSSDMFEKIFKDVNLRKPDFSVEIKGKRSNQFFELQKKLFKIINKEKPNAIIYHGDTLTTLSASIIPYTYLHHIKKIHIEGGYRSTDKGQSEERLRYISDHMSDYIFVQRKDDKINLKKEGINKNVFVVGNSINDSIRLISKKKQNNKFKSNYVLCTIHRQENVNNKIRFQKILKIVNYISKSYKVIFSIHPRTKKEIYKNNYYLSKNVKIINPTKYSVLINLIKNSNFILSDSGGIQEESVILKKQCLVPLDFTPHSFYLGKKSNILLDLSLNQLKKILNYIEKNKKYKGNFKHGKNVSKKISSILLKKLNDKIF